MMKTFYSFFFMMVLATPLSADFSAQEIIQKADQVRNPDGSYFVKVKVESTDKDPHLFYVAIDGPTKTLIETVEPTRSKGRNLLMLGDNMWAYIPNLRRAVRVSVNQKLTGQAVNSDISRTRWNHDYYPRIEKSDPTSWQIFLTAKKRGLTYDKVRVWVEKISFQPFRAEYLTTQEKVLKNVTFTKYKYLAGRVRPSVMIIEDAIKQKETSTLTILDMKVKEFPSTLFSQKQLGESQLERLW